MTGERPNVKNFALRDHKVTRFLLAPDRAANKGRAKFFIEFGFSLERPDILARALLQRPRTAHTFRYQTGTVSELRLIYDGFLESPDGRRAHIRTIWNYDAPPTALFITAFPLENLNR
ncbi:DUF6883 domain-containing protein [uncultured Methylobacterium sp.]|uniref:DUF6883 domain-containing protein n=1 Tax=uncultured Methylobacterium sp. TaxID=157278 RepID=UPI0035CA14F7